MVMEVVKRRAVCNRAWTGSDAFVPDPNPTRLTETTRPFNIFLPVPSSSNLADYALAFRQEPPHIIYTRGPHTVLGDRAQV